MLNVETSPGQGGASAVAVDLDLFFRMKIVQIYLFLVVAPRAVVAQAKQTMEAIARALVVALSTDEVKTLNNKKIWEKIYLLDDSSRRQIDELREKAGIEITPESVALKGVGFSKEDQKAQSEAQRATWMATAQAAELLGSMLAVEAKALGKETGEEARTELQTNKPERLKELQDKAIEVLVERKLIEAGAKRFILSGLEGLSGVAKKLGIGQQGP